jgi:hypothetical protein
MECLSLDKSIPTVGKPGLHNEVNMWNLFFNEAQMLANLCDLLFYINSDIRSHFQTWRYNSIIQNNSVPLLKARKHNVSRIFFYMLVLSHRVTTIITTSSLLSFP